MNEPPRPLADSVLPQTLREAVGAFRSSRLRLRALIPWASDATLVMLTDELTAHEKTTPSSDGRPPGAMLDPEAGPAPVDLFQGSHMPDAKDFPTAKAAIVWALGTRGQATAKEIGTTLAGYTVAGKPLSPFALSRLLVTHPDVISAGHRQDPRHPKRSNAVYALRSHRPGVTLMTQPVRPSEPEKTDEDIFAKAQEVSEAGFSPFAPAPTPKDWGSDSLDPEAEAVRAATGLPLAPKGTHFSSPADLVRECLKIKSPADSPDLHAIVTRRAWKFRGKTPDLKTLSTHLRTLVNASVLHVAGSNHRGVGRPYHLYALGSDKPAPDPTVPEAHSVTQEGPPNAPVAPPSAPSIGPTQSGLIRSILVDHGPLTPGEIAERAKDRTATPPSCGQVSAQLLRGQSKLFRRLPDSGRWEYITPTIDAPSPA